MTSGKDHTSGATSPGKQDPSEWRPLAARKGGPNMEWIHGSRSDSAPAGGERGRLVGAEREGPSLKTGPERPSQERRTKGERWEIAGISKGYVGISDRCATVAKTDSISDKPSPGERIDGEGVVVTGIIGICIVGGDRGELNS